MFKNNENGRSMVEMLGVLAIIGVLSVAGIVGYTIAMRKYHGNEIAEAVSMLAVAAKTANSADIKTGHETYEDFFNRSNPVGAETLKAIDNNTVQLYVANEDRELCHEVANNFGSSSSNALYVSNNECDTAEKLTFTSN